MVDWFPIDGEPRLVIIQHDSTFGVDPKEIAHVALLGPTVGAFPALPSEHREGVVPRLQVGHSLTHALNNSELTISFVEKFMDIY